MLSSFFDSTNHDRLYSSGDFAAFFKQFIGNGVFANPSSSLQVMSGGGLNVTVSVGSCFINGYRGAVTAAETVTLSEGSGTYGRFDLIVARLDLVARDIHIEIIEGDPAEKAVYPELVRNETFYDIALAAVSVAKNAVSVSQADITDTRFDTALCGIVTGVVDTIDTSDLFAQYQAAWDLLMQSFSGDEQAIIAAYDNLNRIRPLEIGGTNLLFNTGFNGRTAWYPKESAVLTTDSHVLKVVPVNANYSGVNQGTDLTKGKYTLSADIKADASRNIKYGANASGQMFMSSVDITSEWQHIKFSFEIPADARYYVFFQGNMDVTPFYLKNVKLERGTEATYWSPSPYDTPAGMQRGTVTLTPSGNQQVPVNVQFAVPYKVAPSIAASSSGYQTSTDNMISNSPIIYNKTTTGFTVNSHYANAVAVDWVAVGEYDTTLPTVTIKTQPQNMSAANGASATCSVTAEGTNLSYQWLFSTDNGVTWRVSSGKTAQYTVIAQTQYNGYLYRCRVTNGAGVAVLSDAATLTVTD